MTMQQVNLYQSVFKKQSEPLMVQQLLVAVGGFVAFLVILSLYRQWNIAQLEARVQDQQQQLVSMEYRLKPLQQAQASIKKSPVVERTLQQRQAKVNTKQQLLKIMSQRSFGNTRGFTEQLTGLAQQRIEGLWLTSLTIRAGGVFMDMQGNSVRPELLPQYIQRLSNENIFVGTEFESLEMQRDKDKPGLMSFNLKSQDKAGAREQ